MDLNIFDSTTQYTVTTHNPMVIFNYKSGVIRFNMKAIEVLQLKQGTKISLMQDKSKPNDWYLSFNLDAGMPLSQKNHGILTVSNKNAVQALFKSCALDEDKAAKLPISTKFVLSERLHLYPIITAAAKKAEQ